MAYEAIEPFGEYREELRHGQLMQVVDKIWLATARLKRDQELRPVDFMNFTERPEAQKLDLSDEAAQAQIDRDVFGM